MAFVASNWHALSRYTPNVIPFTPTRKIRLSLHRLSQNSQMANNILSRSSVSNFIKIGQNTKNDVNLNLRPQLQYPCQWANLQQTYTKQRLVKNSYTVFHENPAKGSVAEAKWLTKGVLKSAHIRKSCSLRSRVDWRAAGRWKLTDMLHGSLNHSASTQISAGATAIMTDAFRCFLRSCHTHFCILPHTKPRYLLPHPFIFIIHTSSHHSTCTKNFIRGGGGSQLSFDFKNYI